MPLTARKNIAKAAKVRISRELCSVEGVVSVEAHEVLHVYTFVADRNDEALRDRIYEVEKSLIDRYPGLAIDFVITIPSANDATSQGRA